MKVEVIVAVIAAGASIVAAALSTLASRRATNGAREIASVNHRVARLDAEADQLRADFAAFMVAVGATHSPADTGALLGAAEVLCANPRANESVADHVDKIRQAVTAAAVRVRVEGPAPLPDAAFLSLRSAIGSALAGIAEERSGVLAAKDEHSGWLRGSA